MLLVDWLVSVNSVGYFRFFYYLCLVVVGFVRCLFGDCDCLLFFGCCLLDLVCVCVLVL